jgi:CRISPR-associated protein Cmr1
MRDTNILEATFRVVTPMFLGGTHPDDCAELREPSIKAALRFWYRAIDSNYRQHEGRIFGGTGEGDGQALFLLRVVGARRGNDPWSKERYACFDDPLGPKNGIQYLSYSLILGDNKRKAIEAGQEIKLLLTFRKNPASEDRRRIASALWLLGHLGGLGSRSRRGFGTVALRDYRVNGGGEWPELSKLLPVYGANTPNEWLNSFAKGRDRLRQWFETAPNPDHTVLDGSARFYLFATGHSKETKRNREDGAPCQATSYEPWEGALNMAGRSMQDYRQRRTVGNATSDYERVKAHLVSKAYSTDPPGLPGTTLTLSPERASFGLPLAFRYNSFKVQPRSHGVGLTNRTGQPVFKTPQTILQGKEHDRSASSLFIRIVEIGTECYPFFALLDAPLLAPNENLAEQGSPSPGWTPPGPSLLSDFCINVLKPAAVREVVW